MSMRSLKIALKISVITIILTSCVVQEEKQPNILFLFADDWAKYASIYRGIDNTGLSDIIETPNIDRLANEGALFTNAFMPAPSCTPCRAAILTGQYIWKNGRAVNLGGGKWPKEPGIWEAQVQFPEILEELGYANGFSGKIGVDWWPNAHPFYKPEHKYTAHGNRFMNFSQFVMGTHNYDSAKQVIYNEVINNFRDLLANRDEEQPFFYWFGPYHTHRSWIKGSGKVLWNIHPDDLEGKLPPDWPDVHEVREDVADYLGEVKAFDVEVGLFLNELERIKELDNTIIVASGDNGIPGFPRAKRNLYDKGCAAPLMIRWGDRVKPKLVIDDFVNLIDLAPTFIEAAGGSIPETVDGKSLLSLVKSGKSDLINAKNNHVILARERHTHPYPMRAIRTKDYLYIKNYKIERRPEISTDLNIKKWMNLDNSPTKTYLVENMHNPEIWSLLQSAFGPRPEEELYDVMADPHQMKNLATKKEYLSVKMDLNKQLTEVLKNTGDPRELKLDTFDKLPYTTASEE